MPFKNFQVIDDAMASPHGDSFMAHFLRDRGERMKGSVLPEGFDPMALGNCYHNATEMTLEHGLQYYEGYAWREEFGLFPFEHAWCVDPTTRTLIDVTWEHPENYVYLGVFVETDLLLQIMLETRVSGVFDHGFGFAHKTVRKYFGWSALPRNPVVLSKSTAI